MRIKQKLGVTHKVKQHLLVQQYEEEYGDDGTAVDTPEVSRGCVRAVTRPTQCCPRPLPGARTAHPHLAAAQEEPPERTVDMTVVAMAVTNVSALADTTTPEQLHKALAALFKKLHAIRQSCRFCTLCMLGALPLRAAHATAPPPPPPPPLPPGGGHGHPPLPAHLQVRDLPAVVLAHDRVGRLQLPAALLAVLQLLLHPRLARGHHALLLVALLALASQLTLWQAAKTGENGNSNGAQACRYLCYKLWLHTKVT